MINLEFGVSSPFQAEDPKTLGYLCEISHDDLNPCSVLHNSYGMDDTTENMLTYEIHFQFSKLKTDFSSFKIDHSLNEYLFFRIQNLYDFYICLCFIV